MVAIFHDGKNIDKAVYYNEDKVNKGVAKLIAAPGFFKEAASLSLRDKLARLQRLAATNERVTANLVHISLNFDPSEHLDAGQLAEIASVYMDRIGFGGQPYLLYKHEDAGHPHVHIVSTNITRKGLRISLHNIGRNQSARARKEIEEQFGLVRASGHQAMQKYRPDISSVQAIRYGKTDTAAAIAEVVRAIVSTYRFTSLPEFNAVLKQYNVAADRGAEDSFMFKKHGLQYRILDSKDNKIGTPVKASAVKGKPTLKLLEKKFALNEALRRPHKDTLKRRLDAVLNAPGKLDQALFRRRLAEQKITVMFRQNEQGRLYGLTFIDHVTRCVFNGSDLGKAYSANAICVHLDNHASVSSPGRLLPKRGGSTVHSVNSDLGNNILKDLLSPEKNNQSQAFMPKKKKKKKRRGNQL